jgi:hypothetical protein
VLSAPEQRKLELEFRETVGNALEERWKTEGRYSAKEILGDVRANEQLWQKMTELFAQQAAVVAIRREMAKRDPGVHPSQEQFPFARELPVPSITYKGSVVSTLRSSAEEFIWFSNWYEHRYKGQIKRSKFDKKTLARIKRFERLVLKYRGDDPQISVEGVVRTRQERLEGLRKQRKGRRR